MAQLSSILLRLLLGVPLACSGGCWGTSSTVDSTAERYQVASSSMAPTLLGPTLAASCPHCHYAFPVAAETYRSTLPTRCPNCGGLCDVDPTLRPGQTVRLEPLADPSDVHRGDLIAFRNQASNSIQVKRVWGLPGEAVELRGGEAWIDGAMLRKSLAELLQVAVSVYDLERGGGGRWWCSEAAAESALVAAPAALRSLPVRAGRRYHLHHVRPAPVHPSHVPAAQWQRTGPVVDDYSVNQGLSTAQHTVSDGIISLQLQRPLDGWLRIGVRVALSSGERILYALFQAAESSGRTTAKATLSAGEGPRGPEFSIAGRQRFELGWCDGRLLLETDLQSRVVEAEELRLLPAVAQGAEPEWQPHEICRVESAQAVDISRFRFARDLYLTSAGRSQADDPTAAVSDHAGVAAAHTDGFYVLGDNLPASRDSRQELGRVPSAQVIGRIAASPSNAH